LTTVSARELLLKVSMNMLPLSELIPRIVTLGDLVYVHGKAGCGKTSLGLKAALMTAEVDPLKVFYWDAAGAVSPELLSAWGFGETSFPRFSLLQEAPFFGWTEIVAEAISAGANLIVLDNLMVATAYDGPDQETGTAHCAASFSEAWPRLKQQLGSDCAILFLGPGGRAMEYICTRRVILEKRADGNFTYAIRKCRRGGQGEAGVFCINPS